MADYFDTMPPIGNDEARLEEYKRRAQAEEWWRVNAAKFKVNLGMELSEAEQMALDRSQFGNAAS